MPSSFSTPPWQLVHHPQFPSSNSRCIRRLKKNMEYEGLPKSCSQAIKEMVGPHPDLNAHQRRSSKKKLQAKIEQHMIWLAEETTRVAVDAARVAEEKERKKAASRERKQAAKKLQTVDPLMKKAEEDAAAADIAARIAAAAARKKAAKREREARKKAERKAVKGSATDGKLDMDNSACSSKNPEVP